MPAAVTQGVEGQDQQVEYPHFGQLVAALRKPLVDGPHRHPVGVHISFVAAYEAERPLTKGGLGPTSSPSRYLRTILSRMGTSAGRFGCSAFVILENPTPRMSANASNSSPISGHGTDLAPPAKELCGAIWPNTRSIVAWRSRMAFISMAEMRPRPGSQT